MARVKLGQRRQITIPAEITRRLGLKPGDDIELVESHKAIILIPRRHIPKDQRWYYTDAWQRMMQEAFDELKKGEVIGLCDTAEAAIRALKETKV